jgi:hypothetical protein
MARVQKIDNAQKKYADRKAKRKEFQRIRVRFFIFCEGEKTEPNYFCHFPQEVGAMVFEIYPWWGRGGESPNKLVDKAIELKKTLQESSEPLNTYDRIWTVFDRDNVLSGKFNAAIRRAREHKIGCAWSNEAFELWYLLHFHNRTTSMGRKDYKKAIEDAMNDKIKHSRGKKVLFKYEKNSTSMYALLDQYGDQAKAIQWAEELADAYTDEKFAKHNPCTHVFELVEELRNGPKFLAEEITKDLR